MYEVSRLKAFCVIALQQRMEGQTDRWTDRGTKWPRRVAIFCVWSLQIESFLWSLQIESFLCYCVTTKNGWTDGQMDWQRDKVITMRLPHKWRSVVSCMCSLYWYRYVLYIDILLCWHCLQHHVLGVTSPLWDAKELCYWRAPKYRKELNYRMLCCFAHFKNGFAKFVYSVLCEKLKPHTWNGQITTNNKHFTVENVLLAYPSTYVCAGGIAVLL